MTSSSLIGQDARRASYTIPHVRWTQYSSDDGKALHANSWKPADESKALTTGAYSEHVGRLRLPAEPTLPARHIVPGLVAGLVTGGFLMGATPRALLGRK